MLLTGRGRLSGKCTKREPLGKACKNIGCFLFNLWRTFPPRRRGCLNDTTNKSDLQSLGRNKVMKSKWLNAYKRCKTLQVKQNLTRKQDLINLIE